MTTYNPQKRKVRCRLCGATTVSTYGICIAHSDLQAAADEATMLTTMTAELEQEYAALTGREDTQARKGKAI